MICCIGWKKWEEKLNFLPHMCGFRLWTSYDDQWTQIVYHINLFRSLLNSSISVVYIEISVLIGATIIPFYLLFPKNFAFIHNTFCVLSKKLYSLKETLHSHAKIFTGSQKHKFFERTQKALKCNLSSNLIFPIPMSL